MAEALRRRKFSEHQPDVCRVLIRRAADLEDREPDAANERTSGLAGKNSTRSDQGERSRRLPTDVIHIGVNVPTASVYDVLSRIAPAAEASRRAILLCL